MENYILRKHKLGESINFDIEHSELNYADCSPTHHGLQCNHMGGSEKYIEIQGLCKELVNIIKKIDVLNSI
jgi:hypothetical protein